MSLRSADVRVWLLTAGLAALGSLLWVLSPDLPELSPHLWWGAIAVLLALTERFVVHVPLGKENYSLSFNEAPLVMGLFFLTPDHLVLAGLVGVGTTMALLFRAAPIKIAFNLALWLIQATVAIWVFVGALYLFQSSGDTSATASWLAVLAAMLATHVVSSLAVFAVISVRVGQVDARLLGVNLSVGAVGTLVVTDLGLLTALIIRREPAALGLLAVLGVLTFLVYRGYHVQRLRYGRLELLYEFTRSVDESVRDESVLETINREARTLLRARHSEVVPCDDAVDSTVWWRSACEGHVLLLPRGKDGVGHTALRRSGHLDGLAAPLRDGGRIIGVLLVADRLDDVSTFDREDARLFEALAGHASIALANSGLVDRIRAAAAETEYLSRHDPLTGLPNRLHFQQQLERRLLSTGAATVLLMDLDRFKEVNDTLGHDVGDQLLEQVGHRLRRIQNEETVVARLGGDEFAVLLGDDDVHLEGMVQRISRDFGKPFYLGDVDLDVSASIGIAVGPRDGSSAALLLRRAEVAMYDAKHRLAGVSHYSPDRDPYSARRLSLISDLARALDEGTLELHYQPQADPRTGQVRGVEALLRWKHPVWGAVTPDEFVPLAEHTGLIRPLTGFVIETAVRQCAAWRAAGTPVQIAVNVSMRNLLEPELADIVARLLLRNNLPASLLKLEVTESAIVSEPERAVTALERMVDLGLSVSVDDFGTGYSSLTRLRNLPVHEVKIDREFVRHIADNSQDLAIVRAVINLGHDLGLRVVAEGVEEQSCWSLLEELDCDLIQGFLLARPMPAHQMTVWLTEHFASYAVRLHRDTPAVLEAPPLLPAAELPTSAAGDVPDLDEHPRVRRTGNGGFWPR
jgi:diguanylate cyclase (GGDEF)-like protein